MATRHPKGCDVHTHRSGNDNDLGRRAPELQRSRGTLRTKTQLVPNPRGALRRFAAFSVFQRTTRNVPHPDKRSINSKRHTDSGEADATPAGEANQMTVLYTAAAEINSNRRLLLPRKTIPIPLPLCSALHNAFIGYTFTVFDAGYGTLF